MADPRLIAQALMSGATADPYMQPYAQPRERQQSRIAQALMNSDARPEERATSAMRSTLYPGEETYFKANPNVAGMAADDDRIILNPYSSLTPQEKAFVALNEYARIVMRQEKMKPPPPTPGQLTAFQNSPYGDNPEALAATIIARMISGDPSAGVPTDEHRQFADDLRARLPAASAFMPSPPFQPGPPY